MRDVCVSVGTFLQASAWTSALAVRGGWDLLAATQAVHRGRLGVRQGRR